MPELVVDVEVTRCGGALQVEGAARVRNGHVAGERQVEVEAGGVTGRLQSLADDLGRVIDGGRAGATTGGEHHGEQHGRGQESTKQGVLRVMRARRSARSRSPHSAAMQPAGYPRPAI